MSKSKYQKTPNPKQLYSRFKQRMLQQPTTEQLQNWENEGGRGPTEADQVYVATLSWNEKIKYYASKFWKILRHPHLNAS